MLQLNISFMTIFFSTYFIGQKYVELFYALDQLFYAITDMYSDDFQCINVISNILIYYVVLIH